MQEQEPLYWTGDDLRIQLVCTGSSSLLLLEICQVNVNPVPYCGNKHVGSSRRSHLSVQIRRSQYFFLHLSISP